MENLSNGWAIVDLSDRAPYSDRKGKTIGVVDADGKQLCSYSSRSMIAKFLAKNGIECPHHHRWWKNGIGAIATLKLFNGLKTQENLENKMTDILSFERTEPLREHFIRSNYAVFLDSIVGQLPHDIKEETEYLWSEYAAKFPIASTHQYHAQPSTEEYDEDDELIYGEPIEATVFPVSLMYSMPDDWQERVVVVMDAMRAIELDDRSYKCELIWVGADQTKYRVESDPYSDRWSQWESDSEALKNTWYPYGK